jgi:hypothetical protein
LGKIKSKNGNIKNGDCKRIKLLIWSFQSNDALDQAIAVARQNDAALKIIPGDITEDGQSI